MALYLGIDLSTQGVKAELIDPENPAAGSGGFAVGFGADLPQYGAPEGFVPDPDPLVRAADPAMWLDAFDLLFARMRDAGAPLGEVAGISGSAQEPRPREDAGGAARSVSVAPLFPDLDGPFDGAGVPGT